MRTYEIFIYVLDVRGDVKKSFEKTVFFFKLDNSKLLNKLD